MKDRGLAPTKQSSDPALTPSFPTIYLQNDESGAQDVEIVVGKQFTRVARERHARCGGAQRLQLEGVVLVDAQHGAAPVGREGMDEGHD